MTTENTNEQGKAVDEKSTTGGGEEMIPKSHLEKILQEKKNWAEKARKLEEEKAELEKAKLKEKEDYKAMYEMTEAKNKELDAKIKEQTQKEITSRKFTELKKEWQKMGLKDEKQAENLFRLANADALKYDEEHKVVLGVEEEAKRIKEIFVPLFGASAAGANHDAPKGGHASLTLDQWRQMSPEDRRKHEADLYRSMGVTVKK